MKFALDWRFLVIVLMSVFVIMLLYTLAMQASGKKCKKWSKKYNMWTGEYIDKAPCLDWE